MTCPEFEHRLQDVEDSRKRTLFRTELRSQSDARAKQAANSAAPPVARASNALQLHRSHCNRCKQGGNPTVQL
jgi:hypothetical protein